MFTCQQLLLLWNWTFIAVCLSGALSRQRFSFIRGRTDPNIYFFSAPTGPFLGLSGTITVDCFLWGPFYSKTTAAGQSGSGGWRDVTRRRHFSRGLALTWHTAQRNSPERRKTLPKKFLMDIFYQFHYSIYSCNVEWLKELYLIYWLNRTSTRFQLTRSTLDGFSSKHIFWIVVVSFYCIALTIVYFRLASLSTDNTAQNKCVTQHQSHMRLLPCSFLMVCLMFTTFKDTNASSHADIKHKTKNTMMQIWTSWAIFTDLIFNFEVL